MAQNCNESTHMEETYTIDDLRLSSCEGRMSKFPMLEIENMIGGKPINECQNVVTSPDA
tara:strand:+ start:41 stop:217 length:177 start_codon:yes stop_codon:yes gene_type:complete